MNVLIEEGYGLGNATIKVVNTVKGILYILGQQALSFSNVVYKKDKNIKKKSSEKKRKKKLPLFYATFQCGRYDIFKEIFKKNFDPEKVKKRASKVAQTLSFHSPAQTNGPQPRIDFS